MYAAKERAPIILVNNSSSSANTKGYYQNSYADASKVYVFGGTAVVSDTVVQNLSDNTLDANSSITNPVEDAAGLSKLYTEDGTFPNIEVYLFGSLTTDRFELESDIDIAVKGLLEEHYFKAYRIAEDIAEPIPIDFIQFEFAQDSMRERIVRDGVRI